MTAAIVGFVGAVIGTVATLVGSSMSDRRHVRHERARWLRDQQVAAYEGAIRHLLRAANRASMVSKPWGWVMVREMLDDVMEAQLWMHVLTSRCDPNEAVLLKPAAMRLDQSVLHVLEGDPEVDPEPAPGIVGLVSALPLVEGIVSLCFRDYIARARPVPERRPTEVDEARGRAIVDKFLSSESWAHRPQGAAEQQPVSPDSA